MTSVLCICAALSKVSTAAHARSTLEHLPALPLHTACACRASTGYIAFAEAQQPHDLVAATARDATLGCVTQLTAMVNLLRDNLALLATAPDISFAYENTDVSGLVQQALKDLEPMCRTSKVNFVPEIERGLHAATDAGRCDSAHRAAWLCCLCTANQICHT